MVFARGTLEVRRVHFDDLVHDAVGTAAFVANAHAEIRLALVALVVFPECKVAVLVETRVAAARAVHVLERFLARRARLLDSLYIINIIKKHGLMTMRAHQMLELPLADVAIDRQSALIIRQNALIGDPEVGLMAEGARDMLERERLALEAVDISSHIIVPIPQVHLFADGARDDVHVSLAGAAVDFLSEIERSLRNDHVFAHTFHGVIHFRAEIASERLEHRSYGD